MIWHRWRVKRELLPRRKCFHHDPHTGESFLYGQLIDLGARKMWMCRKCDGVWF